MTRLTVSEKMKKKGLQLFTSWCHPTSKFQIGDFKVVADLNAKKFLDKWESFLLCHGEVLEGIKNEDYFEMVSKWNRTLAGKNGIITEMEGVMFDVCLMKRHLSRKNDSKIAKKHWEGKVATDSLRLIDRLVYERLDGMWKGTGDTRAAERIEQWKDHNKSITKISDAEWESMIAKMCWGENAAEKKGGGGFRSDGPEESSMGQPFCEGVEIGIYSDSKKQRFPGPVRSFLLHYYFMCKKKSPIDKWGGEQAASFHWDHIIPESLVSKSTKTDDKNRFGNNITNCQALPQSKNTNKSSHALDSPQCKQNQLAKAIETYSGIKKSEQKNYGDGSKLKDLCIWRGKHIIDTFLTERNKVI